MLNAKGNERKGKKMEEQKENEVHESTEKTVSRNLGKTIVVRHLRIRKYIIGDSASSTAKTIFNAEIPTYFALPGMFTYIDPRYPSIVRFVNMADVLEIGMDVNNMSDFLNLRTLMLRNKEVPFFRWPR